MTDGDRKHLPTPSPGPSHPAVSSEQTPTYVVGIGASAGGLRPLIELVSGLPADTGAAFVVIQHLDPTHESQGPELLSRRCSMPVSAMQDGMEAERDHVYLLPPATSATLREGRFRLEKRRDLDTRTTDSVVDRFFRSLERERGRTAVGVLLSGSGSDGTIGVRSIHEGAGLVLLQDPATAEFDGMLRSALRTGVADAVLPVPELADALIRYIGEGSVPDRPPVDASTATATGVDDRVLPEIVTILREETGQDFTLYKAGTLLRRLDRRLHLSRDGDVDRYLERLRRDPDELEALSRDFLITVTDFFRDPGGWEALAEHAIEPILAQKSASDTFRAWVPACATGEEVYALAILLDEGLSRHRAPLDVKLFATDVSRGALEFARQGLYAEGIAEHVSDERLDRYFERENDHYRVARQLREFCVFAQHDILYDPPFSRLDLVSCRNLLIYLRGEGQERVSSVLQYALRPGGFLFLGNSEHIAGHEELFETVDRKHSVFRRNDIEHHAPTTLLGDLVDVAGPLDRPGVGRPLRATEQERDLRHTVQQILLQSYGPAGVLINHRREVVHYFGRTGRYLEPSHARGRANVVDMAQPGLRTPLHATIRRCEEEDREVVSPAVEVQVDGDTETVDVLVRPVTELGRGADFLMVVFQRHRQTDDGEVESPAEGAEETASIRDLEKELHRTRQRLHATIEQLETSNEELRSSNEELLTMNEELQTAKEEAQSVNEELKTVNAELETKIEALDAAHNDLQNLFRSTRIATLFLDRDLRIERFTPDASDVFRIRESDVGRPLTDLTTRFDGVDLESEIQEFFESLVPRQIEVRNPEQERWFSLRISPYRTEDDAIEGIVLTFTDISELKATEAELRRQRTFARSIVETVHEPLVVLDSDLRVQSASDSFYELFDIDRATAEGAAIDDLGRHQLQIPELLDRLRHILETGTTVDDFEIEARFPSQGQRTLLASARQIHREGRKTGQILLTFEDITAFRDREQAREEEMERKDWFLAMLGHELRNPITPMQHCVDLWSGRPLAEEESQRLFRMMRRQIQHLTRLLDDLLEISRISTGKLRFDTERLDAATLVSETVQDHGVDFEEAGVELQLLVPDSPVYLIGDGERLVQAMSNLLSNARKYTPSGGRVTTRVRRRAEGSEIDISISDTGIGMSDSMLQKAFEAFHQGDRSASEERGLGLGLTLVRLIVEAHDGTIQAESEGEGHGTTIRMRLPMKSETRAGDSPSAGGAADEDASGREPSPSDPNGAEPVSHRILVVEDEADAAEMLRLLLEREGQDVATAESGESALEIAREFRPGLVLCDLQLSGEMDGYDVAEAIRADPDLAAARLVAVSGFGQPRNRRLAEKAGFDEYIVKPLDADHLHRLLHALPAAD